MEKEERTFGGTAQGGPWEGGLLGGTVLGREVSYGRGCPMVSQGGGVPGRGDPREERESQGGGPKRLASS